MKVTATETAQLQGKNSREVSPGGSAPSHQKGHGALRNEGVFWDQMW